MDLYADNILDHYRHPHHKEHLDAATVTHEEKNLSCGDILNLQLKIDDGRISSLGWSGDGCAISQAGMSILSDELLGKTIAEVSALKPATIYALLGVPVGERRKKCALLSLHTVLNTLRVHGGQEPQGWNETAGEGQ